MAAPPIEGRRARSAGRRRSRADREKRRWPPGVVKTLSRPASLQRRRVAGETPSTRLASERPTQSGSRDAERTKIYSNLSEHHRLAHCTTLEREEFLRVLPAASCLGRR